MENTINSSYINVSVLVNEQRQPIYRRQHDRQAFIAGVWGAPFVLEVRNCTPGRIEVLSSVDGRNTLHDEPADVTQNRGMIINAYGSYRFAGWRIDDNNSAAFVFTDPAESVAQMATGQACNAGVFGFAVYTEQQIKWAEHVYASSSYGAPLMRGAVSKGMDTGDMGTGIGDVRADHVGRTSFVRAQNRPAEIVTIQYRSLEWLERNGILTPDEPNAFPGAQTGYAQYLAK